MKIYLEISISANEHQRELLLPKIVELGCEGFQETDSNLLCYVEKSNWSDDKFQEFKEQLKNILHAISMNAVPQFREFPEVNWNEQWEKTIQPIEIGNKFVIKPSWCKYINRDNRIVIQIDPKMSFGTGYHETTRLTLRLLEKYLDVGFSILDVGTGTGILAIAAVKLGAQSAVGTDIDEWSIENAKENIVANHVHDKVEIRNKPLQEFISTSVGLITANLTLNTHIEMLEQFKRILKGDGILLLSGLLLSDQQTMIHNLKEKRFQPLEIVSENEWIAIAAKNLQ